MTAPRQVPANHLWSIPPGTPPAKCRSCEAEIFWIKTPKGKNMPVSVDCEGGGRPGETKDPEGYGLGVSHFANCAFADQHRRPR